MAEEPGDDTWEVLVAAGDNIIGSDPAAVCVLFGRNVEGMSQDYVLRITQ